VALSFHSLLEGLGQGAAPTAGSAAQMLLLITLHKVTPNPNPLPLPNLNLSPSPSPSPNLNPNPSPSPSPTPSPTPSPNPSPSPILPHLQGLTAFALGSSLHHASLSCGLV